MKLQFFSDIEYSNRRKKTKREEFLDSMDEIIPWDHWIELIREHYPSGQGERSNSVWRSAPFFRNHQSKRMISGCKAAVADTYLVNRYHNISKKSIGNQIIEDIS